MMKKQLALYMAISILNLGLFFALFSLFQNDRFYTATLGKISSNYERTGDWNHFQITKVNKPYTEVNNSNLLWWDAAIYQCISERMYTKEEACYGHVRAAFFPLFPALWKVTNSSAISISIINYFLFAIGLALLFYYLYQGSLYEKLTNYALFLAFPTVVIFLIPYTEALFLFCMAIVTLGLIKSQYGVYFVGALLLAMVRPATVFVLIAILIAEVLIGLRHRNLKLFLKDAFLKGLPFGMGYSFAILIQYLSSGSWTAFTDSHNYWSGGLQKMSAIVDWSIEGFGMNAFAIIVISLPALTFVLYVLLSLFSKSSHFLNTLRENEINYLFLIAMLYLSGIMIFTGLTSGGNLHSYFRFTLNSPLFYIGAIILLKYINETRSRYHLIIFGVTIGLLIIFLSQVPYGGDRITFSYLGLYLLIATTGYFLIRKFVPKQIDLIMVCLIIITNTIWTTYLFNCYLSNGWIFT
jgi:hypothetical protein